MRRFSSFRKLYRLCTRIRVHHIRHSKEFDLITFVLLLMVVPLAVLNTEASFVTGDREFAAFAVWDWGAVAVLILSKIGTREDIDQG